MGKARGRDGDGLKYLGIHNGKKRWEARLTWTDPRTGKKRDSKATYYADSKLLAAQERGVRIEQARTGVRRSTRKAERKRFREAAEAWFATIEVRGTQVSWGSHKNWLVRKFGDWWLDAVTTADLQEALDSKRHLAPVTVNHMRTVALKIYAYAAKQKWTASNPALETERRNERKERANKEALEDPPKRSLTMAELVAFLADLQANDSDIWPLACTQFVLGQRFAEVSAMRLKDIDWGTSEAWTRRGQVLGTFGPAKGRYARHGAVGHELLEILKTHRARMADMQWPGWEELLFPRPPRRKRRSSDAWSYFTVRRAYQASFVRLGLDVKTATHVLRRAMINASREEASNLLVRKVTGHAEEKTQLVYTESQTAEVIQLADYLGKALKSGIKSDHA